MTDFNLPNWAIEAGVNDENFTDPGGLAVITLDGLEIICPQVPRISGAYWVEVIRQGGDRTNVQAFLHEIVFASDRFMSINLNHVLSFDWQVYSAEVQKIMRSDEAKDKFLKSLSSSE